MQILVLVLLARLILNDSVEIENFVEYSLKNGSTTFVYHFDLQILPKFDGNTIFLFRIFNSNLTIYIYE